MKATKSSLPIELKGSIDNISYYRMRGVPHLLARHKGGPTKEQILNDKSFERTRGLNKEFGGRSTTSACILKMLQPLKPLADYNIAGSINTLLKPAQETDTESAFGKRHVLITNCPGILEGFSLNNEINFESIVRAPVACTISRETLSAEVTIPALIHGANFKPNPKYQSFGFQVVLGVVPDHYHGGRTYYAHLSVANIQPVLAESKWFECAKGSEAQKFELKQDFTSNSQSFTLIVAIGIRYGSSSGADQIKQVKYAGAAKIVRAG